MSCNSYKTCSQISNFINILQSCLTITLMKFQNTFCKTNNAYVCVSQRFLKISLLVGSFFGIVFIMSKMDTKITIVKQALRHIISASLLSPWAAFATVWSLGATSDYNSRLIFNEWVREVQRKYHHSLPFPEDGLVFDYR